MSKSAKHANALETLANLQKKEIVAIKSSRDLSEYERKTLLAAGYIQQVIKGWYVPTKPDVHPGDTTSWYSTFWKFCGQYFAEKYGNEWSLSPEQSIQLHVGNQSVPKQLLVRSPKAGDKTTDLLHDTSIYDLRGKIAPDDELELFEGLRIYKLPIALIESTPAFFSRNSIAAKSALGSITNASVLLPKLIEGHRSTIAGRLCGAFRSIGASQIADDIKKTMTSAGHEIRETDPFENEKPQKITSQNPKAIRLQLMWQQMRATVIEHFPSAPGKISDTQAYLKRVEGIYKSDAYHSLSIEGYQVTPELIEKIRNGQWNPDENEEDQNEKNALAARGYNLAFNQVQTGIERTIKGEPAAPIAREDHNEWFRQLFTPSVQAGITSAGILSGYRQNSVTISGSRHVPPAGTNIGELMSTFFDLLEQEDNAAVRVVLGHFIFVYIHPYPDGNGRTARFLMNLMMASGGYPWTVIPVSHRNHYMSALESASVEQNIEPFTRFLGRLVSLE